MEGEISDMVGMIYRKELIIVVKIYRAFSCKSHF